MRRQNLDFSKSIFTFYILAILILSIFLAIPFPSYAQHDFNELIKQVQQMVQHTYDDINSASFKGHSKTYVYFGANPLEINLVPVKNESYFDGFWMKPDSLRIIIKALHEIRPGSKSALKINAIEPLPDPELEKELFTQSEYSDRLSKKEEDEIITEVENEFYSKHLFYDLMDSKVEETMKSMVFVGLLLSINIAFSSYSRHDDCPLCLTGNFSSFQEKAIYTGWMQ